MKKLSGVLDKYCAVGVIPEMSRDASYLIRLAAGTYRCTGCRRILAATFVLKDGTVRKHVYQPAILDVAIGDRATNSLAGRSQRAFERTRKP